MKGTQKTQNKVRITLDLSPEFYTRLEDLTASVGAESKAQVIREALRLYEYVVHHYIAGDEFLARTKDGVEKTIVLLGSAPTPA
jgi:predicted DNA-binding protein